MAPAESVEGILDWTLMRDTASAAQEALEQSGVDLRPLKSPAEYNTEIYGRLFDGITRFPAREAACLDGQGEPTQLGVWAVCKIRAILWLRRVIDGRPAL